MATRSPHTCSPSRVMARSRFGSGGGFVYTPSGNWSGTDSFMYRMHDGASYSNNAIVTINVTPVVTKTRLEQSDPHIAYYCPWATSSSSSLSGGSYASGYARGHRTGQVRRRRNRPHRRQGTLGRHRRGVGGRRGLPPWSTSTLRPPRTSRSSGVRTACPPPTPWRSIPRSDATPPRAVVTPTSTPSTSPAPPCRARPATADRPEGRPGPAPGHQRLPRRCCRWNLCRCRSGCDHARHLRRHRHRPHRHPVPLRRHRRGLDRRGRSVDADFYGGAATSPQA